MDIQHLPKNTNPLQDDEMKIFENLFGQKTKEHFTNESNSDAPPGTTTTETLEKDMKLLFVVEGLKLSVILLFTSDVFRSFVSKKIKNQYSAWFLSSIALLVLIYAIQNKISTTSTATATTTTSSSSTSTA